MQIVLVGYMASGKSAVGVELAKKLNLLFIDLDDYIETEENNTIAKIFEVKGEIYFRKIESKYLEKILTNQKNFVLSLGGGTPCYANNMELVKKHTKSFYLRTSIASIYNRLLNEKNKRPIVAEIPNEKLQEFIGKHLFERRYFYEQATKTIDTDDKSIQLIVENLLGV